MRRYVQTPGPVGEFSELPLWQRAETVDLVYVGYGLLVVALVLASYLLGAFGWLPDDPQRMNVELINAAPLTSGHLLGTDFLGRDLQARLILGIQAYFLPGLLAITISVVGGSILGTLAGYRGGWFDTIITYFDNLLAGKIAFLRQKSFIEAAHALGLPAHTVILKHILWLNCRALLVIQATLGMAEAILVETSLSYLGFGVQEPTPSWGNMVQAGANYFLQGNFWPSTAPALAILATILGFQLLGDGLNNLLEGKRRR